MNAAAPDMTTQMLDNERRKRERECVALDTLMCDREGRTFGAQIMNVPVVRGSGD